jgi:hypothetical protein
VIERRRLPAVLVLISALLGGCSAVVDGRGVEKAGSGTHSSAAATPNPIPRSFSELEALLISTVPDGFAQEPDSLYNTGPSSLAKAIHDQDLPHAARELTTDGFIRGYQRVWTKPQGDQIIVFLYQFATTRGASAFYRHGVRSELSMVPVNTTQFVVPGLPPSHSTGIAAHVQHRTIAVVQASVGPFAMQINCSARSATGLKARLIRLAHEQTSRL